MQLGLLYNRFGDPTAPRFAEDINIPCFYMKNAMGYKRVREFRREYDITHLIRWGITAGGSQDQYFERVYNSSEAISSTSQKILARRILRDAGIPVPKTSQRLESFDESEYPVMLRRSGTSGGDNIMLVAKPPHKMETSFVANILKTDSRAYLSEYWEKDQEYRVHVALGQPLFMAEKVPRTAPKEAFRQIVWNIGEFWQYGDNQDVLPLFSD